MYIELLLIKPNYKGKSYFKGVPDYLTGNSDLSGKAERIRITEEEAELLGSDFDLYIDKVCNCYLFDGDIDFLNV